MTTSSLSWGEALRVAPELATAIQQRFATNKHHIIGTIRADGSPRLSGTEVQFDDERMTIGMMVNSRKRTDIAHDNRVEIHCAPLDTELQDGDAKVSGELVVIRELTEPPEGTEYEVRVSRLSLVTVEHDLLRVQMFSPEHGVREIRRK